MAAAHRTVVEEKRFSRELKAIKSNPHAADDLVDGAKWVLSREPRTGTQVAPRSPVWFLPVTLPHEPAVGIYYTFDDDEVHLLSITQGRAGWASF